MQLHRTCAFFSVLFLVADASLASSTSSATARQWLRNHPAAQEDELAELKGENPEAYAIVKALLTKRSLGLLDPKHPTASFAAPPPSSPKQIPSGAAAFAKFESPSTSATSQSTQSVMYPEAPAAPAQRDWFSWKPADSAASDDAMVQNVLGAVAELKGQGAPTKSLLSKSQSNADSTSSSALEAHEEDFGTGLPATQPASDKPLTSAHRDSDAAPAATENSYLKDFGMLPTTDAVATAPVVTKNSAAAIQGNSYLRGINLGSDEQAATVSSHDHVAATTKENYLSSFSWGDEGDSKPAMPTSPARMVQKQQAVEKHASDANALTSWLEGGKPALVAAPKPVAKKVVPEAPANPYNTGLW